MAAYMAECRRIDLWQNTDFREGMGRLRSPLTPLKKGGTAKKGGLFINQGFLSN
jgi:hypothetical protein